MIGSQPIRSTIRLLRKGECKSRSIRACFESLGPVRQPRAGVKAADRSVLAEDAGKPLAKITTFVESVSAQVEQISPASEEMNPSSYELV